MIESSQAFESDKAALAATYTNEAVDLAELAESHNDLAEEAWRLL